MAFDFSKAITRETNALVNKGVDKVITKVGNAAYKGISVKLDKEVDGLLNDLGVNHAVRQSIQNIAGGFTNDIVKNIVGTTTGLVGDIVSGLFTKDSAKKLSSMDAINIAAKSGDINAKRMSDLNTVAGMANATPSGAAAVGDSGPSPYASDIANHSTPKHKFLFLVEIQFNDPFNQRETFGNRNALHALIHKFDRPDVEIEHEEVNMYNFITHVPKLVKYKATSFTAYDDGKGESLATLVEYLRTVSPVFSMDVESLSSSTSFEQKSLSFTNLNTSVNSANFAPIQASIKNGLTESGSSIDGLTTIIKEIKLYHVHNFGASVDVYRYTNPKIIHINLGDLDMSSNEASMVTCEFVYDALYISVGVSPTDALVTNFSQLNSMFQYNMVNRDTGKARAQADKDFESAMSANDDELNRDHARVKADINTKAIADRKAAMLGQLKIDDTIRKQNWEVNRTDVPSVPDSNVIAASASQGWFD